MDLARLRAETPGCEFVLHLDAAGSSLQPQVVLDAVRAHLDLEGRVGGYDAAEQRRGDVVQAYAAVARLLGTDPRNIAFVESATAGFATALSAVPFQAGDVLLTTRDDYVSNQIQFLSLARRFGIEVVHGPALASGGVDPEAMGQLIARHRPRLVAVTHVPTNSGLVQPIEEIGHYCRDHDVLYLVDACQSVGQMSVDVAALGADFVSAAGRKFLRGPRGCGFLYVSDRVLESGLEPLFLDMRGARWTDDLGYRAVEDAARFESWEFAYALLLGTGAAARYATSLGLARIESVLGQRAEQLRAGLNSIDGVRVLDRGARRCAIVTASIAGWSGDALKHALRSRGIIANITRYENARFDLGDKRVEWILRVSPHYYTTGDEIARFLHVLSGLMRAPPETGRDRIPPRGRGA